MVLVRVVAVAVVAVVGVVVAGGGVWRQRRGVMVMARWWLWLWLLLLLSSVVVVVVVVLPMLMLTLMVALLMVVIRKRQDTADIISGSSHRPTSEIPCRDTVSCSTISDRWQYQAGNDVAAHLWPTTHRKAGFGGLGKESAQGVQVAACCTSTSLELWATAWILCL